MSKLKVLIVGEPENSGHIPDSQLYTVTTLANYEEAIELLKNNLFDLVITEADVYSGVKNCLEFLKWLKTAEKKPGQILVCHKDRVYTIRGIEWRIPISLKSHYPFASYFEGTLGACIRQNLSPQQKCA